LAAVFLAVVAVFFAGAPETVFLAGTAVFDVAALPLVALLVAFLAGALGTFLAPET
jgi:hypothetical protein